jgi:AAHS family 4-hydroxybenzoate transporter-like MFS transporter
MLSASLFGILFGALIGGNLGDKFGRRPVIIVATLAFSLFTLVAIFSRSLTDLMVLRALAGLGIGAVMPATVSLMAEYAPQRVRATFIILMFTGVSFGSAMPGPFSDWLVPVYGWRALFIVGGVFPLFLTVPLFFALPESLKFLALDTRRSAAAAKMLRTLNPSSTANENDRFLVADGLAARRGHLADLFEGPYALVTPLLWALFVINFMVLYFFNSWMPTLFEGAGASASLAAYATSIFQIGGIAGGLLLSRYIDRKGLFPVVIYFIAAVPVVALVGVFSSSTALIGVTFVAGFCVVGLQYGLNATAGVIYPTHIRANGVGFALGIGRLGAVMGPWIGGQLILLNLSVDNLFVLVAAPMALGAVICFMLARSRRTAMRQAG